MRRTRKYLIVLALLCFLQMAAYAQPAEIWVSPNGTDYNATGTKADPYRTLWKAQRKARELRRLNDSSIVQGINIIVQDGLYTLEEPLFFRPEDAGTAQSPTTILAEEGANPVLSGGIEVPNWKKLETPVDNLPEKAIGKVWVADIPAVGGHRINFRQMWVNNKKATRASNLNDGLLDRILSVDKQKEILWIPKPEYDFTPINPLELVIHQWWAIANLRVKDIKTVGDSAAVTFYQPESRIEFEHPWPAPFIDEKKDQNGNSAFYFVNSMALLNSAGEWYADENSGKIYYWPRKGEKLNEAKVVVPYLETLVAFRGTLERNVSHINFQGIRFEHTTWMRPSYKGHVPLQAGMYLYDAYKLREPGTPDKAGLENQAWLGRQTAAVTLQAASHIRFLDCGFRHMAATGLDFVKATHHNTVKGCVFSDIGGTGIQIGYFGDQAFEAHLPYNPSDERVLCRFETLSNNLVTDVTNEDWGCVGICIGFAHDITIAHNEVSHVNYTGISVGWGWTKTVNCMKNNLVHANYIHHFAKNMYDVAGVYTLGAQPNSEISENRIQDLMKAPYAHIPKHYQYIYYDEGTSNMRTLNNWTEKDKFFENSPGPGNQWENNGPQVDKKIKENAGLLPAYKHLREEYKKAYFPY